MRPLIAGNWKMHGMAPQLGEIAAIAASVKAAPPFADVLICLPATLIARAAQTAAGQIAIGGEDCSAESLGVHRRHQRRNAERCRRLRRHRRTFGTPSTSWRDRCYRGGESESRTARGASGDHLHRRDAIAAAERQGVIGVRRSNRWQRARWHDRSAMAIGYEPLWAIGTGHMPTSEKSRKCTRIFASALWRVWEVEGKRCASFTAGRSILRTRSDILALPDVGGALVGGASLKAADFEAIFRAVSGQSDCEAPKNPMLTTCSDTRRQFRRTQNE